MPVTNFLTDIPAS